MKRTIKKGALVVYRFVVLMLLIEITWKILDVEMSVSTAITNMLIVYTIARLTVLDTE